MRWTKHNTNRIELVVFLYWTRNSLNNLLSYFGLTDARMSASDKEQPVIIVFHSVFEFGFFEWVLVHEIEGHGWGVGGICMFKTVPIKRTVNWNKIYQFNQKGAKSQPWARSTRFGTFCFLRFDPKWKHFEIKLPLDTFKVKETKVGNYYKMKYLTKNSY